MNLPENMITKWHSCYKDGWQDIIVPQAFAHPAKMSRSLLSRILSHAKEQGWIKELDVIVDPFGGIGSTGILGAYDGYQVVCCELEQKFVDLAEQNFKMHENAWRKLGNPRPIILQGDSRKLCEVVEKADCIVSSPPFQEAQTGGGIAAAQQGKSNYHISKNLKSIGSKNQGYQEQGKTPGNLGNLKSGEAACVISSPPYEGSIQTNGDGIDWSKIKEGGTNKTLARAAVGTGYGKSEGQLAEDKGDTFWSAAKLIVQQSFQILKPGGHAIWVVKSFVRKGKIVDFPGDWQRLCESVGFETVCIHHAMLVKETKHKTLFGQTEIKRKERKSFFRRLAESKGSPRIDFEVVLCMSRPNGIIWELKNTMNNPPVNQIICGDCLEVIKDLPDGCVDLVLTDPPYGTTACKWDTIIPLEPMWEQLKRVIKPNSAIVMTASQPFTTTLIASNMKMFKYEWVWFKNVPTGMAQSRYTPMKYHESVLVFSKNPIKVFNKIMEERVGKGKDCYNYEHYCGENNHVKMEKVKKFYDAKLVNPSSVLLFNVAPNRKDKVHPTQKPVALMEYLIKTYTNEGELVLDFTCGSGTTCVACLNTGRNYIGIDNSEKYCGIARQRIEQKQEQMALFKKMDKCR